jgi:anti-sigma regulatory factor (Ser/Thr protein kinase)
MGAGGSRLRHDALVYAAEDEYVHVCLQFLRQGVDAGEAAVVAHTRPGLALLRDALGADAAAVTFVDVGAAYTRPARTLAAYHSVMADVLREARSLRMVADVQFGPDPDEWATWTGYEAALNLSFAHLPARVLCTYDGACLPDSIRDGVWRTHPGVVVGGERQASSSYEQPDRLLREIAREPERLPQLRPIAVGAGAEEFREHLARELVAGAVQSAKALDMLLASTEVYQNAVRHGGGVAAVRVGRAGGRFVCEIVDRGSGFDDPVTGYVAPRPGVGAGLWVARQLTWEIDFFRAADGFTARIWL